MSVIIHLPYDIEHPDPPFYDEASINTLASIRIRHPHLPPAHNQILVLPLCDVADDNAQRGIHYGTLISACTIVAGNLPDGYLTRDLEGNDRIVSVNVSTDDAWDRVIQGVFDCFLHFPGYPIDGDAYDLVDSFADWEFPHNHFPAKWMVS
jgi:hypothetical protein